MKISTVFGSERELCEQGNGPSGCIIEKKIS
jgi:hypothetical protein